MGLSLNFCEDQIMTFGIQCYEREVRGDNCLLSYTVLWPDHQYKLVFYCYDERPQRGQINNHVYNFYKKIVSDSECQYLCFA